MSSLVKSREGQDPQLTRLDSLRMRYLQGLQCWSTTGRDNSNVLEGRSVMESSMDTESILESSRIVGLGTYVPEVYIGPEGVSYSKPKVLVHRVLFLGLPSIKRKITDQNLQCIVV